MRIAVLYDPYDDASFDSGREPLAIPEDDLEGYEAMELGLRKLGHATKRLPVSDDIDALILELKSFDPDLAFNLADGFRRENLPQLVIPALLENLCLPYTGSDLRALGLSTDKALAKSILAAHGIRVPRHQVAYKDKFSLADDFSFPVIVKPLYEDGSYGITGESVVYSESDVMERVSHVMDKYHQPSIVEEFIEGREITAAVFGNTPPIVLPLCEMEFRDFTESRKKIYGFEAKRIEGSFEYRNIVPVCPAPLPRGVELDVKDIVLRAHVALGCRDYSNVDLRLDREFRPYVLEVNANPCVAPITEYVSSLKESGRSYQEFVQMLIDAACERGPNARAPVLET